MAVYQRLFFNNLSNLFGKNFRQLRRLLSDEQWRGLIRQFMIHHRPRTPLFPEIGGEFLRFVNEQDVALFRERPWLAELAAWEFTQVTVRNDEVDLDALVFDADGDPCTATPVLNPTVRIAQFRWPVYEIRDAADQTNLAEQPSILLIWRLRNDRLGTLRINAVTARLIALMQEKPGATGLESVEAIAAELRPGDPARLVDFGRDLLRSLHAREVILGTRGAARDTGRDC